MNYEIKNILVPTDFSDSANNALRVAVGMAERQNATLHLLHVIEPIYLNRTYNVIGTIVNLHHEMLKESLSNLEQQRRKIVTLNPVNIEIFSEIGNVNNIVNTYVNEHHINLVIMGTHGSSGSKEFFSGSNTYSVIKTVNCPVLSIPQDFDEVGFTYILYPLRNTTGVVEKYDYIKPIIEKNNAKVHLLGIAAENDNEDKYLISKKIKAVRDAILHNNEYISYEIIQTNAVAETILSIAHDRMEDLLVINATLDKKWYQYFRGTYTQKIINHSKIPVLSIKPELTPEATDELLNALHLESKNLFP